MLVLSRKTGEKTVLEDEDGNELATIVVTGRATKIGIEAPPRIKVVRAELKKQPQEEAA